MKQADLFSSVCETQNNTSSSDVSLTVSMETTGQTHTKECIDCGSELVLGDNWTEARQAQSKYVCKSCWHEGKRAEMWVNGKYVPKAHPLWKAGRYKSFDDAAFSGLQNYTRSKEGQVYIITNSAWPEWVKIGMAVDAEDRCNGYQTSSQCVITNLCMLCQQMTGARLNMLHTRLLRRLLNVGVSGSRCQ